MYQAPIAQELYDSVSFISEEEEVIRLSTYKSDEDEEKSFSEKEDGELSLEEMNVAEEEDVVPLNAFIKKKPLEVEKEVGFLAMQE